MSERKKIKGPQAFNSLKINICPDYQKRFKEQIKAQSLLKVYLTFKSVFFDFYPYFAEKSDFYFIIKEEPPKMNLFFAILR